MRTTPTLRPELMFSYFTPKLQMLLKDCETKICMNSFMPTVLSKDVLL